MPAKHYNIGVSEAVIPSVSKGKQSSVNPGCSFRLYNRLNLSVTWNNRRWFAGIVGKTDVAVGADKKTILANSLFSVEMKVDGASICGRHTQERSALMLQPCRSVEYVINLPSLSSSFLSEFRRVPIVNVDAVGRCEVVGKIRVLCSAEQIDMAKICCAEIVCDIYGQSVFAGVYVH